MTATTVEPASEQRGLLSSLVHRQLDSYPETSRRVLYLAITVLATITLYYELYVGGSVSTVILANLNIKFTFYVEVVAFGNLLGAFGSLFAGLADRYGRANLVVFGLMFSGVFVAFVLPTATNLWQFALYGFIVGTVEGICLVATPALIRDFSPQVGRATAMGFWTSGPVLGSLIVAIVGAITVPTVITNPRHTWTHEYVICGIAGLVVFVIALFGLRELSPQLRDQLMVSMRDRALVELRAKGLNVQDALKNSWRQLVRRDVIISAFAVAVMLLVYYALVGFLVIYVSTVFGYSVNEANNLGYWAWGFNAAAVILVGMLSDKIRVRKPFMIVGGVGGGVLLVLFALQSKAGATPSFATIATLLALMSFFLGIAYTPWMASYTETVEHHNPAATATGLAIWGWILRVVVFASTALVPLVITSVTPLVSYGSQVQADVAQYPVLTWAGAHPAVVADAQAYSQQLGFASSHPQIVKIAQTDARQIADAQRLAPEIAVLQPNLKLFEQAEQYPQNKVPPKLANKLLAAAGGGVQGLNILTTIQQNQAALTGILAVQSQLEQIQPYTAQLSALQRVPATVTQEAQANAAELAALQKVPASVTSYMSAHGGDVATASANAGSQWRTWWWVCLGGIVVFLLSVPLLRGRWRPRDARRDEEEHEAMMAAELAKLQAAR